MFNMVRRRFEIGKRSLEIRQEFDDLGYASFLCILREDQLVRAIELSEELYDLTVELREIYRKSKDRKSMRVCDANLSDIEKAIWNLKQDYELGCYWPAKRK